MKLLLTSAGLKNQTLIAEFIQLVGKPAEEIKVCFIPTAADVEAEDKGWLIDNLAEFKKLVYQIDILDIAAVSKGMLISRLSWADVLVFGGGSTEYLVEQMKKTGLNNKLPKLLSSRVLVGISAGSVMCGPVINSQKDLGLNYVDFVIVPHKGSPFTNRTAEEVTKAAKKIGRKIYWIDDNCAVRVIDSKVEIVGTGNWEEVVK